MGYPRALESCEFSVGFRRDGIVEGDRVGAEMAMAVPRGTDGSRHGARRNDDGTAPTERAATIASVVKELGTPPTMWLADG